MSTRDDIVHTVVSALAAADGVGPLELEYTLTDHVEPAMLETLVTTDVTGELTFRVPDHEVTVTGEGEVFVDGIQYRPAHAPFPGGSCNALPSSTEQRHCRRLVDAIPGVVYRSRNEPGWPIDFISDGCRELTGYDPNAFVVGGVTFGFDLIHPDDRDRVSETVQEAVRNREPFSLLYRIRTADGAQRWVVENGVGRFDEDDPISFVGTLTDVTDLKSELDVPGDLRL